MAWTDGVTRATGDLVLAADWNAYLGATGSLMQLKSHAHGGTTGEGSQSLGPLVLEDFTDAVAPAAPGAGKTRIYAVAGKPRTRAGAAGSDDEIMLGSIFDAKGDLLAGTGSDAFSRVAVGANDTVLTADSAQAGGVKWATSPSGMIKIAEFVLTAAAASLSFTAIPATYRHLLIVFSGRGDVAAANTELRCTLNGDAAANYHSKYFNDGVAVAYAAQTFAALGLITGATADAGHAGTQAIWLPDYRGTTFRKHAIANGSYGQSSITSGHAHWASTVAVNRIDLFAQSGNLIIGTVATLYGLED